MGVVELFPLLMFVALAFLLFSGFPVAWVLGGVGLGFGLIGIAADELAFIQFSTLPSRIFGVLQFGDLAFDGRKGLHT